MGFDPPQGSFDVHTSGGQGRADLGDHLGLIAPPATNSAIRLSWAVPYQLGRDAIAASKQS
jgi:hypothetical protein